ncbi:MAG: hypothetical protein Q8M20_06950 [Rhodocyclaceae bacterium]|nr:hypothetical protein [Rhodocyclaceae bacterium]MDZ4214361.1 hypothetical protein [Rhodocyclaceae bacterium]
MKIHLLPMGARFEYEGSEYVKTGPQLASGKSGQRLIPKYAVLRVLDGTSVPAEKKADAIPRAAVLAAFETFYARCAALMPAEQQVAVATARDAFLQSLE